MRARFAAPPVFGAARFFGGMGGKGLVGELSTAVLRKEQVQ